MRYQVKHSFIQDARNTMDFQLRGRTALVTGASQGIGRGIARLLALEGVKVVGAARRTQLVEELSASVVAEGGERIIPVAIDLFEEGAAAQLAAAAKAAAGPIDILMNV